MKIKFEMPPQEMLKHNPCCMKMLQNLVKLKTPPTVAEWISLAGDYDTSTKTNSNIKIKDPGSFNVPISINGVFLGSTLCALGDKINLMSLATFRKIERLMMIPTDKLVRVADGTKEEPEGVMLDVKVVVEDYEFLANIVVMDIPECPFTLGRPFLATAQARIKLEYKEIMLKAKGKYLVHHISQDNIRKDACIECHAMEDVDPYKSHEDMEEPQAYREKYDAANTSTDVREGATRGSWRKTPYEELKVRDRVLLKQLEDFYGYLGGLQARKGWDGPFTIKNIKQNKEIVIWDEVKWYTYVDPSEIIKLVGKVEEEESAPKRFKASRV